MRGQFLSLRELDYIQAARSIGASNRSIIVRHLMPNVVAPVSVAVTLSLAGAILTEAGLSFLGLSVQVPTPTWGNMLFGATSISLIENNWSALGTAGLDDRARGVGDQLRRRRPA